MKKWKEIWNKEERITNYILEMLFKVDGFDTGAGSFGVMEWKEYVEANISLLKIKNNDSIYDVGCGSGAFVYPLYLKGHQVGGLDYSSVLIDLANSIMTNAKLEKKEAITVDTKDSYDIVLSHSVFHYFPSLDYAKEVVKRMIEKANRTVAIFDINDKSKEKEYHNIRMSASGEEYAKKYTGLEHLFYEKEWFEKLAKDFNMKITIFDQTYEQYVNSSLRFNVIMEK